MSTRRGVTAAGEPEQDLRIVEMLLPLEADLELRPLDRVQFLVQPDEGALTAGCLAAAENSRWSAPSMTRSVGGSHPAQPVAWVSSWAQQQREGDYPDARRALRAHPRVHGHREAGVDVAGAV
jgi:hypothetical protein